VWFARAICSVVRPSSTLQAPQLTRCWCGRDRPPRCGCGWPVHTEFPTFLGDPPGRDVVLLGDGGVVQSLGHIHVEHRGCVRWQRRDRLPPGVHGDAVAFEGGQDPGGRAFQHIGHLPGAHLLVDVQFVDLLLADRWWWLLAVHPGRLTVMPSASNAARITPEDARCRAVKAASGPMTASVSERVWPLQSGGWGGPRRCAWGWRW